MILQSLQSEVANIYRIFMILSFIYINSYLNIQFVHHK